METDEESYNNIHRIEEQEKNSGISLIVLNFKYLLAGVMVSIIGMSLFILILVLSYQFKNEYTFIKNINRYFDDNTSGFFMGIMLLSFGFIALSIMLRKNLLISDSVYLYNMFGKTKLDIREYQIKNYLSNSFVLYLKTDKKLYMLLPATAEEFKRYPNRINRADETKALYGKLEYLEKVLLRRGILKREFEILRKIIFGLSIFILLVTILTVVFW